MSENSIEILGQKLSYPSTWQGSASVGMVCLCIAFLGYNLEADEIDSYYTLFNGTTEEAYDASVEATATLNEQVLALQSKIETLSETSNLTNEEKTQLTEDLDNISTTQTAALEKLQIAQAEAQEQYTQIKDQLSPADAKEHLEAFDIRKEKIDNQLQLIKDKPKFQPAPPKL